MPFSSPSPYSVGLNPDGTNKRVPEESQAPMGPRDHLPNPPRWTESLDEAPSPYTVNYLH